MTGDTALFDWKKRFYIKDTTARLARRPTIMSKKKSTKKKSVKSSPKAKKASVKNVTKTAPKSKASPAESWSVARLRREWIDYFRKQDHTQTASAGLIPAGDPTLLFTTAGMVQFKAYFAGTEEPPHPRTATIQKCLRTTDLESVGKTDRHLTFFEMLGNFSFGDYFKREAIRFAWEFSLERLKLDPEKIYITVYQDDDEAERIWNEEIGVPLSRIRRLGKEDNWWGPAGDTGACGPCSELYLDRGPEYGPDDGPGGEGDRYMEYWNLVFNEFHQDAQGKLHKLPKQGIDTGAGLERIVALLNHSDSVFDTDELRQIIGKIEELSAELRDDRTKVPYSKATAAPYRVLADHVRCVCFAIADGIFPGNTGRGYVIRRVLRRALLFSRELGVYTTILHRLVPLVAKLYGEFYPELRKKQEDIEKRIRSEEERFLHTLEQGLGRWNEFLAEHKQRKAKVFRGEDAFMLYDTFGFPKEMTIELAEKEGLSVDMAAFDRKMQEQQNASRGDQWGSITLPPDLPAIPETEFAGYAVNDGGAAAKVLALVAENDGAYDVVSELSESQRGLVILDRTPFYAEGGGQLGDSGKLASDGGGLFEVHDTQKNGGYHLHLGAMKNGILKTGDELNAFVDVERRRGLTRHHSATHLLNRVLREKLGDHIIQTGSLVAPDYLRFDFSHPEKIDEALLSKIETEVNSAVQARADVAWEVLPIEEAKQKGAVATFGEKYGQEVRVVSMGKSGDLSIEFCGGCHVDNTGDVGVFHITRETSPGAGNRRIEAVTGDDALRRFQDDLDELHAKIAAHNDKVQALIDEHGDEARALHVKTDLPISAGAAVQEPLDGPKLAEDIARATKLLAQNEKKLLKFERGVQSAKVGELMETADETLAGAEESGGVKIVKLAVQDQNPDMLRKFGDKLKEKSRGIVVLLGNVVADKGPTLLFMADQKAVDAGANASSLIRDAAKLLGGGGGGRPDMAQAGGKDASKMDEALNLAVENLKAALK